MEIGLSESDDLISEIKKLAAIADSSADAMMSVDMNGRFEFWNLGAQKLFGYTKEEILSEHFHKIVPEEKLEEAENKRREALVNGNVRFETVRIKKDGTLVPVDMTLTTILNDRGEPVGIAGNIKDLSEKKRLQEDYKNLFENAKDGISLTDHEGNLKLYNSQFVEMTGYSESELNTFNLSDLTHPKDRSRIMEYNRLRIEGKEAPKVYEFRLKRKNQSYISVEVTASPVFREGVIVGTQGIIRDISERERLESEIRETKNHLESVFDTIQEGICVIDRDLVIISFNEAFAKNIQTPRDKILGRKCYEVLHDFREEEFLDICTPGCIVLESLEKGEPLESVHEHKLKDGELIYHESKALPTKDNKGRPYQVVYVINDITERKKAHEELEKYAAALEQSNNLKDLFSDIMRHDLLNPLGVIKNVSELLEDEVSNDLIEKEISMVHRNVEKIEELVHTAARFGQVESSNESEFQDRDISTVLKDTCETLSTFAEKKNIKITIPTGNYIAKTNLFIEDVFSNLISNAIKYSPPNTEIKVSIDDSAESWRIKVSDRGSGVPDKHKKSIFERFKRVEKGSVKGSGLGLAIVKKVVDLHHGDVWVEDNPGGGSIFIVLLPKERTKSE